MTYDNNGNLTQATDADNNTITWTYDALNRKTGEYDGTSDTAPPIATWTYDNSNDVSGVTDPIGQLTTESAYDKNGDAFTFQDKGFNVFGESLGETITVPSDQGALAGSYTLSHTYTATTGLPLKDTYPASPGGGSLPAETLTHTYIAGFDLPSGLGGLAAYAQDTTYTAWSQVAREEIGSTTANAYITNTYDANTGGLTDTQVANTAVSSTPYDDTSYSYDPSGNVTSETDTRSTAATGTQTEQQCFDYDTLDQLTQAWTSSSASTTACAAGPSTGTGGTVSDGIPGGAYWTKWAYDSLGNQASETDNSVTGGTSTVTNYTYNTNTASCGQQPDTLTSSSTTGGSTASASYTYDCDGNTTALNQSSGNQSLTWNPDGTLSTDTTTAGTTTYVYDAGGNLLAADNPGGDTLYIFGEQLTATSSGTVTGIRYIPLPGGGQAVRTGGGTSYYFQTSDLHGTSLLTLASNAQSPIWRQFTPYGAPRGTATGTWPGTNGYLGDPVNANDSLTTIGARQYTPATGRFLSPDPVLEAGDPAQMGGYAYAADNPATQSDPSGLNPEPTPGPGGGYGSGCTANPSAPGCNQPPPSGPGSGSGTTGNGGGSGSAGGSGSMCARFGIDCGRTNSSGSGSTDQGQDGKRYASATSYNYSFDLGPQGTPLQLAAFARELCAGLFPIEGCQDEFQVGQVMQLQEHVFGYTQGFPVRVFSVSATSFSFVALKGHPEGQGRTITFAFQPGSNGDTSLDVSTSSNGSIVTQWWGIRNIDFWIAHGTWAGFAANIEDYYDGKRIFLTG